MGGANSLPGVFQNGESSQAGICQIFADVCRIAKSCFCNLSKQTLSVL